MIIHYDHSGSGENNQNIFVEAKNASGTIMMTCRLWFGCGALYSRGCLFFWHTRAMLGPSQRETIRLHRFSHWSLRLWRRFAAKTTAVLETTNDTNSSVSELTSCVLPRHLVWYPLLVLIQVKWPQLLMHDTSTMFHDNARRQRTIFCLATRGARRGGWQSDPSRTACKGQ